MLVAMNVKFSPQALLQVIRSFPTAERYWVAYSGGLDSHVLLQALASVRADMPAPLTAIHVNHGLSERAGEWAGHCREVCAGLGVEFHEVAIDAAAPRGESQEAWSRQLRYDAFRQQLGARHMLLTAHQADDQAETLLLQLLRGAGPAGLAAMPAVSEFARGWHARPLLGFSRRELRNYAQSSGLHWVEDESNLDLRFDRNYIRNEVMPRLQERWPGLTSTLGRAAALQSEAAKLLTQLAGIDMHSCYEPASGTLRLDCLETLEPARQRNLLRHWIKYRGLTVPDQRQLQAILTDLIPAREDAVPCVRWPGGEIRRYRRGLYAVASLPETHGQALRRWEMTQPLDLPLGTLSASRQRGRGMRAALCPDASVNVQFREGGESLRRRGQEHHQQLKKLFQAHGIPPWLRTYVPLLYIKDRLASVAGIWLEDEFEAGENEEGWLIEWSAAEEVFGTDSK
jgi:tRNA(Ile)-lysidine synthase